jgi:glycosyltransferase involved in cell wall biosynthesis
VFQKTIVIVTPWFDGFVGGAGTLAKGMAYELNRRGVHASVFTTCSLSPYDDWWRDHYPAGRSEISGIETHRFPVNRVRAPYDATIRKLAKGSRLTNDDEQNFFKYGINSDELVEALTRVLGDDHEVLALPYFQGLTHSAINKHPGKLSLIPCFHDEPEFYWNTTKELLANAKHIFYNSHEEKEMTIREYGRTVGRRVVEGVVTGVGVEVSAADDAASDDTSGVASAATALGRSSLPQSYFVYAGRKERGKNVPLLCEWFLEHVRETGTQSKLVFIGGGDKELLPRSPHILDLGPVSEVKKRRVIQNAKALINLSNNESFSIVMVEAWLAGVPVIASARCAVTTGHVRRAHGGLFVDSREEFSAGLACLESNDQIRTSLGINGRQFASRQFSHDAVLARYLDVLAANGSSVSCAA